MKSKNYIAIDWGTTNFRAFLIDHQGKVLKKTASHLGLLRVDKGQFPCVLAQVLQEWLGEFEALPVYMSGMVGSAQGWIEVAYAETPVTDTALATKAHSFMLPWGSKAVIFPGVSHRFSGERFDVMRGEEVQLVGLRKIAETANLTAVLPGTHSKHASIENGVLICFSTYMTGELYSLLSEHSILGHSLPEQEMSNEAFAKGVMASGQQNLSHLLFSVRTSRLFNTIQHNHVHDYLSGILIGYELRSTAKDKLYIVGSKELCLRYERAAQLLAINTLSVTADECFVRGIHCLKETSDHE